MLFNGRNAIRFVENNGSMILEAKRKASERKGLKILTSKQTLPQVKAGNI